MFIIECHSMCGSWCHLTSFTSMFHMLLCLQTKPHKPLSFLLRVCLRNLRRLTSLGVVSLFSLFYAVGGFFGCRCLQTHNNKKK